MRCVEAPALLMQTLSSAVGALAFASSLGAPGLSDKAILSVLSRSDGGQIKLPTPRPVFTRADSKTSFESDLPELELPSESDWDPEPGQSEIAASQCRALLLDILRRAIHDWVLYRNHSKMQLRELADDAFTWLFKEAPGHAWWHHRKNDPQEFTSFLSICNTLDLDPSFVREQAKKTTIQRIRMAGRPPERRKIKETADYHEHGIADSVQVDSLDNSESSKFSSSYEAHFAVNMG